MLNTLGYLLVACALEASPRNWTDTHGRTITAEYVRVYQGNVILLRGNRIVKVRLGNLSHQDRDYVAEQVAAKSQPHRAPDRERSASAPTMPTLPTMPEPPRASPPVAEAPTPPTFIASRQADSDLSPRRPPSPAPRASAPTPIAPRPSGTSKAPQASPPQRRTFGRMTVEEANGLIVDRLDQVTGSRDVPRQKSTSPADWPNATQLVRVEQDNVPILGSPDLTARKLDVFGVADAGEILALVDRKSVFVLPNFLSNAPDQSGTWYKVQMLDGKQGWIFAEPQGQQARPTARLLAAEGTAISPSGVARSPATPQPGGKQPQTREPTPSLGESLLKPLSDPKASTPQRVGRGIGMVIGGALAALALSAAYIALLLTAGGGWRWWWWRERFRRMRESQVFSWFRRRGQPSADTT